jgi:hypothetical protein
VGQLLWLFSFYFLVLMSESGTFNIYLRYNSLASWSIFLSCLRNTIRLHFLAFLGIRYRHVTDLQPIEMDRNDIHHLLGKHRLSPSFL